MEYQVNHLYCIEPEPELPKEYPGFTRYSCRAEAPVDVVRFLTPMYDKCVEDSKHLGALSILPLPGVPSFPDCTLEFVSDYTLEELKEVMLTVEDSHVMVDTLRPLPLVLNSLNRWDD